MAPIFLYINFLQNRVSRSVKTLHTNLFAQIAQVHKFATTNSNFEKNQVFLDMHHHKNIHVYQFSAKSG